MPILWKSRPEISLCLAGARPHPSVQALEEDSRIRVTGWVDDIRKAYQSGKIFVAPLFTGSGQQNKILEAMAMGQCCVTTSLVNNAIHAKADSEILIADEIPIFAHHILRLLQHPEQIKRIGTAARSFVESQYSWESSVAQLEILLQETVKEI